MLRLPEAKSPKENFISGKFEEILDDELINNKKDAAKIIITSGKVYYDLTKYRTKNKIGNTAIVRIEQFYPFNKKRFVEILELYPNAKKIIWLQEEPKNMGAWNFLQGRIGELITDQQKLICVSRPESASPAVGSGKLSNQQQINLVEEAYKI
jgi:2-oxoglutarate dehydrogenase E1 component